VTRLEEAAKGPATGVVTAYFSLGSNLGDREANIRRACMEMAASGLLAEMAVSSLYETEPWGPVPQGPYLNCVVAGRTAASPQDLLHMAQSIEASMGRVRDVRWGPRIIDIDILLLGGLRLRRPELEIPHPRMWERAFVLVPLAELCPTLPSPGGEELRSFVKRLPDLATVRRLDVDMRGVFGELQNSVPGGVAGC
jgi:2-amino-4-hydroxy-6-hydroxymethyldihydropteridine diphosphokinase